MTRPDITDRVLFLPYSVFSLWEPSHTISWGVRGILHFIVSITWLLAVCSWALPLLHAYLHARGIYRRFHRQRASRNGHRPSTVRNRERW
jgi:hypothetical protein